MLAPRVFRAAAAKVGPSIVRIEGFGGIAGGVGTAGFQPPGEGATTGLVISSNGYIVTSTFNFLRQPPIITVVLPNGERKVAKLLGRDESRRLCVLKVDGVRDLAVPTFAPRKEAKVGQWAIAVGVGFGGQQPALSAGIISATERISAKALQTDANLSPANYGGPLIDIEGRVLGLCVPLSPDARDAAAGAEWYDSGIGFAVPLAENESRLAALKEGKNFQPGFLGVQVGPTGDPPRGAKVTSIVTDSPAMKGGIEKDDEIVAIGDDEVLDAVHLRSLLGRYDVGDKLTIQVRRGEERKSIEVELAVPPAQPEKSDAPAKTPEKQESSQ